MRIISQDGKWDLPYDHSMVYKWRANEMYQIKASPIGEPDSDYLMGNYSTEEKAEKAMEMLRMAYCGICNVKMQSEYTAEEVEKFVKEMKNAPI